MAGLRTLSLLVLAAAAVGEEVMSPRDEVGLMQKEVHLMQSDDFFSDKSAAILSPQAIRGAIKAVVLQVHQQISQHASTLEKEHEDAMRASNYMGKLKSTLGRKGTLFGDVIGLMPRGQMDDLDRGVAMTVLGLLQQPKFSEALIGNLKAVAEQVQQYRWRMEKRVGELTVKSANATEDKLPVLLRAFFSNQHTTLSTFLATAEKGMREVLAALPANHSVMAALGNNLVDDLMHHSQGLLDNNTEAILASQGSKFCAGLDIMMAEELVPIANQTVNAMLVINDFARANMPEVAPQTKQIAKVLSGTSKSLTLLYEETGGWIERVCGLVGAAAS